MIFDGFLCYSSISQQPPSQRHAYSSPFMHAPGDTFKNKKQREKERAVTTRYCEIKDDETRDENEIARVTLQYNM